VLQTHLKRTFHKAINKENAANQEVHSTFQKIFTNVYAPASTPAFAVYVPARAVCHFKFSGIGYFLSAA